MHPHLVASNWPRAATYPASTFEILPHFNSFLICEKKSATPPPPNPEKGKTTLNSAFPPLINHVGLGSEAADFNLHVSQGRSKPIPPEMKGWFN